MRIRFCLMLGFIVCSAVAACTVPNEDPYADVPDAAESNLGQGNKGGGAKKPATNGGATMTPALDGGFTVDATAAATGGTSGSVDLPATGGIGGAVVPPATGGMGGAVFPPATGGTGGSVVPPATGGIGGAVVPPATGGMGGSVVPPATGGMGGAPVVARATAYDFETDAQGWRDLKSNGSVVARTTGKAASGTGSLEVTIDTTANGVERYIGVPRDLTPVLKPGQPVKYQVWIPSGSKLLGVQPFVVTQGTGRGGVGRWQGAFRNVDALAKDGWSTISVDLPADYEVNDLEWVGVQFITQAGGWKGSVFIDAVLF